MIDIKYFFIPIKEKFKCKKLTRNPTNMIVKPIIKIMFTQCLNLLNIDY